MTTGGTAVVRLDAARYDAVVFDMDGVLTDTAVVHQRAWKEMFDEFLAEWARRSGAPQRPFDAADYLAYVDGRHRDDGVAGFLRSRGIALERGAPDDGPEHETVWGLASRKNDRFRDALRRDGVLAFPTSVALVRDLQRVGVGTAVVSASRNAADVLRVAGIGDLFAVRVDGVETARLGMAGKPAPDMFLEAARRLGASPSRSVVVEDALAGVEAGRAGSFALVIGVDRTGREAAALRRHGADVVVGDLGEISVGEAGR